MVRPDRYRPTDLEARIDRLESLDEIRQLPHRYALAVDTRNLDDLVALFVDDVRVGRGGRGRSALRAWFVEASGWDVGYIQYWDHYERRDGVWYFVRRDFHRWFMVDVLTRPRAGAGLDQDGLTTGRLPEAWPSWGRFWDEVSRART
ncbi:MAG: nuclear transport factor 2 family protein [Gemmatimonadota bacterium]